MAALDSIRASHYATHPDVYDRFRNDYLHGIEQADDVFGLALVNMIFRGDGKSRIYNGNCFDNKFVRDNGQIVRLSKDETSPQGSVRPFARVLMNPPFAMPEPEYQFVNHALEQTVEGGLLFAVVPNAVINGLTNPEMAWREETIRHHTVRAVLRMPRPLFQPNADKITYSLILEAWRPHEPDDKVFFAVFQDQESASRLSKFVKHVDIRDNVDRLTRELRAFMAGAVEAVSEIPAETGLRPLRLADHFDFSPEAYLDNPPDAGPSPPEGLFVALTRQTFRQPRTLTPMPKLKRNYTLDQLFGITRGTAPALKYLKPGETPVITTSEVNNGIAGYFDIDPSHIHQDAITITANGGGGRAFWHPYGFAASKDVLVCQWRGELGGDAAFKLFVCDEINRNAWRFSWSRKSGLQRLLNDVQVVLPMRSDGIDFEHIRRTMERAPGYNALCTLLSET